MAYVELERSAEKQPVTLERVMHAASDLGLTALRFLGRITPLRGNLPEQPLATHGDYAEMYERVQNLDHPVLDAEPLGWPDGYFTPRPRYTDHWALRGSHPTWQGFPGEQE